MPKVEKACPVCGKRFSHGRSDKVYCSDACGNLSRGRRWYHNNPEKTKEKRDKENRQYRKRVISRVKSRAKRNGIPFSIGPEDINVPQFCPILGLEIIKHTGRQGFHPQCISVDRINPKGGYTKDNIQIISGKANLMKNDATPEELLKFAEWIMKTYG